jgi:hypothetical protein
MSYNYLQPPQTSSQLVPNVGANTLLRQPHLISPIPRFIVKNLIPIKLKIHEQFHVFQSLYLLEYVTKNSVISDIN